MILVFQRSIMQDEKAYASFSAQMAVPPMKVFAPLPPAGRRLQWSCEKYGM